MDSRESILGGSLSNVLPSQELVTVSADSPSWAAGGAPVLIHTAEEEEEVECTHCATVAGEIEWVVQ